MPQESAFYTHGHHESVLRSHRWRTAANSAAYLLSSLRPNMHILDIGCGPGTITIDLATLVPQGQVTGLEYAPDVLEQARMTATERRVTNVQFVVGDVHSLQYPDNTFDIVHAHQVLQHVRDPIQALREMRRVAKPGGIVANRECDYMTMTWYPEVDGMNDWQKLYERVARSNGGEPNAGRRLHAWARRAGFDWGSITATASTWCYQTPEERAWWSGLWADRTVYSAFAQTAVDRGYATKEELARIAQVWREWGEMEDGWFVVLHGEIICRV
jgi:SAM-dependent methyltransferase